MATLADEGRLAKVHEKLAWALQQEAASRDRLLQSERVRGFWERLSEHVVKEHPANILLVLRNEPGYIRHLEESKDALAPVIAELRTRSEAAARETTAAFGRDFPKAARDAGLEIDSTSRHPLYTFRQGFVQVEVSEAYHTATLRPRDGDETVVGLDIPPLVETLTKLIARIFDRPFQPDAFLRTIHTAYTAIIRAEKRPVGDAVPLRRVTSRLSKNLNRFAGDEFNFDLARLIRSGHLVIDGQRLHLDHTRYARQGMLLHGLEQGGYVGFVSFKEET